MKTEPWLCPKANNFLVKYFEEHKDPYVLEFGIGGSTVWFSQKTKHLCSVEHDSKWYDDVSNYLKNKVQINLLPRPYHTFCDTFVDNFFDLILVDGRDRVKCIESSIRILKSGGILMLDNSERPYYQKGINLLKTWKRTTVEFIEPPPSSWETSWWVKP